MRPEYEAELSCLLLVVTGRLGGLPGGRWAVWSDLPMEGCGELETDKQLETACTPKGQVAVLRKQGRPA